MSNSKRPVIPPERTSARIKHAADIKTQQNLANTNAPRLALNSYTTMDPFPTRKRKSTANTQDTDPQASAKRRRTTNTTIANIGLKNTAAAGKPARKPRLAASQLVQDMTGKAPSGFEAQKLALDPDGHRSKMVKSDPTKGPNKSSRGSISKPPKKRSVKAPKRAVTSGQDRDEQQSLDLPADTLEHVEFQLPTPESTQETPPPVDDKRSAASLLQPASQIQEDVKPAIQTSEHTTVPVNPNLTSSSDALSDVPSGFSDFEVSAPPSTSVEHSDQLAEVQPTSTTATIVDAPTPKEIPSTPGTVREFAQPRAEVIQTVHLLDRDIEDPMMIHPESSSDPSSGTTDINRTSLSQDLQSMQQPILDPQESARPRSRRSVKPVQRFGQLLDTDVALTGTYEDATKNDTEFEKDVYDISLANDSEDDENDALEPDKTLTIKMSKSLPIPQQRLNGVHSRPVETTDTGLITLKVPAGSSLAKAKSSRPSKKDLTTVQSSSRGKTTKKIVNQSSQMLGSAVFIDEAGLDPNLLKLAKKLSDREPVRQKPDPCGKPEVWADSRQALCETLPYFRVPQSGCHSNDCHVYAFFFDATGHCREYMDSDVIIARAGGGMERDGATQQMLQKKDHLMTEAQVQAVLNDIDYQNPVVIIAGNKYEGAICRLPHRYNVLGWYKPVAVWAEKTLGKGGKTWNTIKYRFERLDPTKTAWHATNSKLLTEEEQNSVGALSFNTCNQCNNRYPVTYLNGWMCLNPDCGQFWKLSNNEDAPYGKLYYHPAFLLSRTRWLNEQEPFSVRPPVPTIGETVGDDLTFINTRGICCPQCGRCSSRRLFKGWKCDNPTCTYQNFPKHIPVTSSMINSIWKGMGNSIGNGPRLSQNKHEKEQGVNVAVSHRLGFKIYTYTFDGVDGRFVHAVSNSSINKQAGGPDEMFVAMQQQDDPGMDLHLERRRFNAKWIASADTSFSGAFNRIQGDDYRRASAVETLRRESFLSQIAGNSATIAEAEVSSDFARQIQDAAEAQLDGEATSEVMQPGEDEPEAEDDGAFMTAYSINYGMPYKFIATGASLPFDNAPWPVRACQADLNWASNNFLTKDGHQEFNELLIFAYMEGQKIEYHDDGESGLGPRISTMSLGGKAKMHLRMKQKHYVGCSKTGIFNAERPVPGSFGGPEMYQKRLHAWNELQELDVASKAGKAAYERRRKEIPKELGLYEKRTKKAGDLVTVTLNHGDIVLMEGYEIQQYLEHKVVPESCLRFALTCRTVLPDHLKPEEMPKYDVGPHDPSISSLYRMDKEERQRWSEMDTAAD